MAESEKIRIGVIFPMTGPISETGVASQTGLQMALDESPGNNIEILLEDDAYDPKRTVAAFTKLTSQDRVDLIFGLGSGTTNAIAPHAQRLKIPVISLALNVAGAKGNPFVVRTSNPGAEIGELIGKVVKDAGYKKVGVIVGLSDLMVSLEEGIKSSLPPQTILVNQQVAPDESDFRSVILKMRAQDLDAAIVLLLPGKIGLFAKQARELGLKSAFVGTMFFESKSEVELSGGALIGSTYVMHDSNDCNA